MDDFSLYFKLGLEHIISPDALDHQLFLLTLVAGYSFRQIKPLLVLITAFTLGHSITLALTGSGNLRITSYWIELLIPFTILISGLFTVFYPGSPNSKRSLLYSAAGLFGLIHGMGFANTLKAMLGKEQSLLLPLFGFNLGIELGQILVILVWLSLFALVALWIKKSKYVARFCGLTAMLGALWMVADRF